MSANQAIRTFICIELSPGLKLALQQLITHFQQTMPHSSIAWVKAQNLHLTLRFLGDVDLVQLPLLSTTLATAMQPYRAFSLMAAKIGAFPNLKHPKVFWVGVTDSTGQLLALQRDLELALQAVGLGAADKPFSPHLTLGRVRQLSAKELAPALESAKFEPQTFAVNQVVVMRSDLQPQGARYSPLAKVNLNLS
jgi:RNA 2',3'-cyclic 3'-phosphodiesterase